MKKIISILLAVVMSFSVVTVAFAADETDATDTTITDVEKNEEATEPSDGEETTDPSEGEGTTSTLDWILDLPFWTVGPALKFAKIALKLVKVYVKLAIIFGIIDKDDITGPIEEMIKDAFTQQGTPEEAPTEPTIEPTTVPDAA